MTLIAEFHDPDGGSVFICDCLVTYEGDTGRRPSDLPLHRSASRAIETCGAELTSKFLTSHDRLIMGSGTKDNIVAVAESFLKGNYPDLAKLQSDLDGYYEREPRAESFIYGIRDQDRFIISDTNCVRFTTGHLSATCGGSGAPYFKELFQRLMPEPSHGVFQLCSEALGLLIFREFSDPSFPDHHFGGAYEMLVNSPNGLARVPYAVIELDAESELARDGVYDINRKDLRRLVICVPFENSSRFINFLRTSEHTVVSVTNVTEPGKDKPPEIQSFEELAPLLRDLKLAFNVVLISHKVMNYVVMENVISLVERNGEPQLRVDHAAISRAMANWSKQPG